MFSPIFAISSSRRSSRPSSASGPSASTASSAASAKARNSSFLETGSVSQPTATIAPTLPETVASTSPSVVARPAFLPAAAMPCSRRSRWAASTSPPVSSSARLAAIIPAPVRSRSSLTRLAEIWTWLMRPPPGRRARERAPARPQLGCGLRFGLGLPARAAAGSASGSGSGWVSSAGAGSKSAGLARCLPSAIASPSACTIRLHERIASSLPGITKSASSGSQFVSTSAITGIPSRRASFTASCSLRRSTMKIASGCLRMSATPPRFASSFSSSACIEIRSLGGSRSSWPSSRSRRSSCRCSIRSEIVRQLVSRPPSQRWFTYGMPVRLASSSTESWACFLVPTKRTVPPRSARLRTKLCASSRLSSVFCRSMM